jgi:hypothetical protein
LDASPPSLSWNVFNKSSREQADYAGSATANAKRGDPYRIILQATDPQGAQSIEINPSLGSGEMSWQCIDPPGGESLAQNKTATLAPETLTFAPNRDGKVPTKVFIVYDLDFQMACPSNWSFASGSAKLTGRSANYSGVSTTEVITFVLAR